MEILDLRVLDDLPVASGRRVEGRLKAKDVGKRRHGEGKTWRRERFHPVAVSMLLDGIVIFHIL